MLVAFLLSLLAALPDALLAVWLKVLGEGVIHGDRGQVRLAAVGLALSATATWFLTTVSTRVQRRFRDKVTIALESHVAKLQASVTTIAHQERPDYLDRLSVLRNQIFVLDHMYMSVFSTAGWILRLGITVVLLGSIHPALVLLVLCALPTVLSSSWRPSVERGAEERGAPAKRLSSHLFTTATTAPPGKEVRVTGIGPRLATDRREAWEQWYRGVSAARWGSAVWHTLAWALFGGVRRRHRVRIERARQAGRRRAARARGRLALVGLHRRDRRRDRLPARHLDGRLPPPRLARGLRRIDRGQRGPRRARPIARRHHARARVVRLPRHRACRARRRVAVASGRRGGGHRR